MNLPLKDLAFRSILPPSQKFVWVAIAQTMRNDKSVCKPSVALLSRLTGYTDRTVKRVMADFRKCGTLALISRGRKGVPNVYRIDMGKLSTMCAKLGDTVSPNQKSGDTVSPNQVKSGDTVSPNQVKSGDTVSPIMKTTLEESERVRNARKRAATACAVELSLSKFESNHVFVLADGKSITAENLANSDGAPLSHIIETLQKLKRRNWKLKDGQNVTSKNVSWVIDSWWEAERDKGKYLKTERDVKTVTFKPEQIKHAELLCKEFCKMYHDGKCKAGLLWSELRGDIAPRLCEGNPDSEEYHGGRAK